MPHRIGLQLYTLREAIAADMPATIRRVAEMGFDGVETAFFESTTPEAVASELRTCGLTVFAAHAALPLGDASELALRQAELFGCSRIVWHGWPEDSRYSTRDGIDALAEEYNAAAMRARGGGLQLGLHNHWWEMTPVGEALPYRMLLAQIDPSIFFEVDTYWARVAGLDPAAVVAELGARAPLLHIKDGPATRHEPMLALGTGVIDIPAIVAASQPDAWLVVELDECATDMAEATARSVAYLRGIIG